MRVSTVQKPHFNIDQIVPASKAAQNFAEVRKKAKNEPQFISQNNHIDSVVQSYADYEKMYAELEYFRELFLDLNVSKRIAKADSDPKKRYSLKDVMGEERYSDFKKINPNSIADDELFE